MTKKSRKPSGTSPAKKTAPRVQSTRAGSHAGRGFRYQDAAAAWLAVRCWNGDLPFGELTPEGRDDAELIGAEGSTFVQIKSRREHLGPYTPGEVAADILRK